MRSILFRSVFVLWTAVLALVSLPLAPFWGASGTRSLAAFWMRGVHFLLKKIIGLEVVIEGLEHLPDEPVIIASKHQSALDTLVFHTIRKDLVVGYKEELGRIPLFGWYMKLAGNVKIARYAGASALRSLVKGAKEQIEGGASLLIFPEGTRTEPGAPPSYKPGIAALYRELNVPCVPVALNSGLFWSKGHPLREGTVTIQILPPIPPGLERKLFVSTLQDRIETATLNLIADVDHHAGIHDGDKRAA